MKKKNIFCAFGFTIVGVLAVLWIWNTFFKKEN